MILFLSLSVLKFSETSTYVLYTLIFFLREDSVKKQLKMFSLFFDELEANFPWMVTQLNGQSSVLQCELIYKSLHCS